MESALIALHDVGKRFDSGVRALDGVSLTVAPGEFVTLLGPSGCGKSTVLRLVAGLDAPSIGRVLSPAVQDDAAIGFVFQDATLMPWADVFDNVWLPLRLAGRARDAADAAVRAALAAVGLSDFASAFPAELSGGMRMRVSIARALLTQPRVLLMDEPFAALDEITRQKLSSDLLDNWQARRPAVLFVTHSVYEAVFLSQRVLVMSARPGRVIAEVPVDEPYPRSPDFRLSPRFADRCRTVSQALAQAQAA